MPNFIAEVERKFTYMVGLLNIRAIGSLDPVHISKALNQTGLRLLSKLAPNQTVCHGEGSGSQ